MVDLVIAPAVPQPSVNSELIPQAESQRDGLADLFTALFAAQFGPPGTPKAAGDMPAQHVAKDETGTEEPDSQTARIVQAVVAPGSVTEAPVLIEPIRPSEPTAEAVGRAQGPLAGTRAVTVGVATPTAPDPAVNMVLKTGSPERVVVPEPPVGDDPVRDPPAVTAAPQVTRQVPQPEPTQPEPTETVVQPRRRDDNALLNELATVPRPEGRPPELNTQFRETVPESVSVAPEQIEAPQSPQQAASEQSPVSEPQRGDRAGPVVAQTNRPSPQQEATVESVPSSESAPSNETVRILVQETAFTPTGGNGPGDTQPEEQSPSQPAPPVVEVQLAEARPVIAPQGTTRQAAPDLPVRIIDQVVREVRLHRWQDGGELTVRLNPPDLGILRVRISQDAVGLSSQIQASTEQVRGLLQAHLPVLSDALANAGLKMDSISVTSGMPFSLLGQDATQDNGRQQSDRASRGSSAGGGSEPVSVAQVSLPSARRIEQAAYSWLA